MANAAICSWTGWRAGCLQEVLSTLDSIGDVRGAGQLRNLLAAVEPRTSPAPQRFEALWRRVSAAFGRVARSRFAAMVVGTLLVL